MFRQIFGNIPDVTKNLLILNVLFFLVKGVLESQGINAGQVLGMHYPASQLFEPYQIVTHFFMHGDLFHILFNMIGLVVIGSHLERVWGKKRFFIFYFVTAFGAMLLHIVVEGVEIYNSMGEFFPTIYYEYYSDSYMPYIIDSMGQQRAGGVILEAGVRMHTPVLGASGAVYGLLMAFALLFPNTEFRLLFPPIPIKAKWLALILGGIAVYNGILQSEGDSVAHFAHLGGMLFGFIMIKIWQRNQNTFY